MTIKSAKLARQLPAEEEYSAFLQLDGRHPWQDQVPEGMILYPTRTLPHGKVTYFNFELAKEMELIPKNHPRRLNKKLCQRIVDTFSLRIVNEYDQQHKVRIPQDEMREHPYMATRYLQMQHSDRAGRTSGDGRCIWNGTVKTSHGEVWDVSSRGTGVTALAPGSVEAGRPLKSGNNDHGYGCGMAEIDELYAAAIQAEIFYRNGIPTERVLAIVDLGKGMGIGVRAAPNLVRPAHMFMFLRQMRIEPLKRAMDYFIDRQWRNHRWTISPKASDRYSKTLEKLAGDYARFAAYLERDYIFAWLDWDGDNVLADAGIIDYGSVRQFGLRHDQYRYDDVSRLSTNLNEQRIKARDTVQTFAQLMDYLHTGRRKNWRRFRGAAALRIFDQAFETHSLDRFLYQVGFNHSQRRKLLSEHRSAVKRLYNAHCNLERTKTFRKKCKVADGVHRPAIYNMRNALALMPRYLMELPFELSLEIDSQEFYSWILSSQASRRERRLRKPVSLQIRRWQQHYLHLLKTVTNSQGWEKTVRGIEARATVINGAERLTGNALINVVDEILIHRRRGLSDPEIQTAIDRLIDAQTLDPDLQGETKPLNAPRAKADYLVQGLLSVVYGHREDI
jgi:uncharacterized protein YdiU (UPF0061 family)